MNTYVYELDKNLYINLTNKCSNACDFCVRNGKDCYFGNPLWLEKEPDAEEVIRLIDLNKDYGEFVFCGFGEPTYKIEEIITVGEFLKSKGKKVRLNTNGHGSLINGYDIAPRLKGAVDVVSVSLNDWNADRYQSVCRSVYGGAAAFNALIEFAVSCKNNGIYTVFSIVDLIGAENIEKCRELANKHGIPLKIRTLIENS